MALVLTRASNAGCTLCRWDVSRENHQGIFARQALPIVWDFSEGNPFSEATGNYGGAVDWIADVVNAWPESNIGQVHQADAADHPLPDQAASTWFTDPPYYDAVPYADLSDYFVVWLKRTLPGNPLWRNPFEPDNPLSPKVPEAVQDETKLSNGKPKDRKWFEETMGRAFREGRRVLREDGVGSVVFAHKTTEGWEALLTGMIRGGWIITGSWPIATEMGSRLRARDSAALATSIHLNLPPPRRERTCRRMGLAYYGNCPIESATGCRDFRRKASVEPTWLFACIGPALEDIQQVLSGGDARGTRCCTP